MVTKEAFIAGFFVGIAVILIIKSPLFANRISTYHNDEEWEIIKNEEGRVIGIKAHRRAEQT